MFLLNVAETASSLLKFIDDNSEKGITGDGKVGINETNQIDVVVLVLLVEI